eukprot:8039016-Pyramimonas_sp.AAC.1
MGACYGYILSPLMRLVHATQVAGILADLVGALPAPHARECVADLARHLALAGDPASAFQYLEQVSGLDGDALPVPSKALDRSLGM